LRRCIPLTLSSIRLRINLDAFNDEQDRIAAILANRFIQGRLSRAAGDAPEAVRGKHRLRQSAGEDAPGSIR